MTHTPSPSTTSPQVGAYVAPEPFPFWVADPAMPGCAKPVSNAELEAAVAAGLNIYGSFAGCVLYENVQACAFDRPISLEPTWNGARVLANGWSTTGLEPDGVRATYRVVATPGRPQYVPPLWPGDARLVA